MATHPGRGRHRLGKHHGSAVGATPTWAGHAKPRRRPRPDRFAVEPLEPRVLLSDGAFSSAPLAGQGDPSSAPIFVPAPFDYSTSRLTPLSVAAGTLIGAPAFRGAPAFAGVDGRGYSAVVIDTGIDVNHPFFGPDADGNGVADRIVYQWDFADNDADASDVNGHGSNVAGVIGASDSTLSGIAPAANIIALKVFSNSGAGTFAAIEAALRWVVDHAVEYNVVSVNMSLGDSGNYATPRSLYGSGDELATLAAMGVLVVAAAGNSYGTFAAQGLAYPAADPNVFAVGAVFASNLGRVVYGGATAMTSGPDRIAPFSQRSATISTIMAPGAPVTSASATGGTVTMHGTSQAAPQAAGAAVLAQDLAMRTLHRRLTVAELRAVLVGSGVPVFDGDDEDDTVPNTGATFSRLSLPAMGQSILAMAPPPAPEVGANIGGNEIASGGTIDFGSAFAGQPPTRTITVTNSGDAPLSLGDRVTVPGGFSLVAGFNTGTLNPGQSANLTIALVAERAGSPSGWLSFTTSDADEGTYSLRLTGAVADSIVQDDRDGGFTAGSAWAAAGGGLRGDARVAPRDSAGAASSGGSGSSADAAWTFTGLSAGRYLISGTWLAAADRAPDAPFTFDNGSQQWTFRIDQRQAPRQRIDAGATWRDLAFIDVNGSTLTVRLGRSALGSVAADGVRVQRMSGI